MSILSTGARAFIFAGTAWILLAWFAEAAENSSKQLSVTPQLTQNSSQSQNNPSGNASGPKFQPANVGVSGFGNPAHSQSFFKSAEGLKAESQAVDYREGGANIAGPSAHLPPADSDFLKAAFGSPILETPELAGEFNPKELSVDKSVPWQKHKNSEGDSPPVEFTTGAPKSMKAELMTDLYEEKNPGLVETAPAKYTLFLPDATPVRATANIKLTEAEHAGSKQEKATPQQDEDDTEDEEERTRP